MHFEEELRVPVSAADTWDFLWEIQRLAGCLPGCVGVQELEVGKSYKVQFEDHVGPYKVHFDLDAVIQETEPQRRIRLLATGQDRRLGVSQKVELNLEMQEASPNETVLHVHADVEVLGKAATLGQFAIKRKAKEVVTRFAQNMEAELRSQGSGHRYA